MDTPKNLLDIFTSLGFARYEIEVLLCLARLEKASSKRISRETNITHNLTNVMLDNLTRRKLVERFNTPGQDTYTFLGLSNLQKYLKTEQQATNAHYEKAQVALEEFLSP